ncbi:MAG: sialidase family protein, partial [Halobacteria archaeon]|nr:sialidase family protein [Halobacteria archaeon]
VVYWTDFIGFPWLIPTIFKSVDGGETFEKTGPLFSDADLGHMLNCWENQKIRGNLDNIREPVVVPGHGQVDKEGNLYVPLNACGEMHIAVSKDEGSSWKRRPVPNSEMPGAGRIL